MGFRPRARTFLYVFVRILYAFCTVPIRADMGKYGRAATRNTGVSGFIRACVGKYGRDTVLYGEIRSRYGCYTGKYG